MRIVTKWFLFLYLFFSVEISHAQITLPSGFSYSYISTGLNQPVGSAFNSDGTRFFVWEKAGIVYVYNWNITTQQYDKQTTPVLNISPEVGNWRDHGLVGFAVDPNFNVNGYIYLSYVVDRHYLMNIGTGSYNANTNNYNSATIGRVTRYTCTTSGSNLIATPASRLILLG